MAALLTPRGRRARSLAGLLALAVVSGCGPTARPRPATPTSAAELMAGIETRREAVTSLRARMRLRSGLARMWTRQAVLVRRPSAIRIDVLSPFGLALAVGTQGETLWAFPPQQGIRYEGPASPASFARLFGTPLGVVDLVDVLLGVPPARVPVIPPMLEREGDEYVVTIAYRGGEQAIRFAADTLEMTRIEERRDGAAPVHVTFADYRDGFARSLDLVGAGDARASIAFDEMEPNVAIDPAAFAPPAAPRVLPLERAAATAG